MRIGLFTDTYFPQVSGCCNQYSNLKKQSLKSKGMQSLSSLQPIRMSIVMKTGRLSVFQVFPFFAFKDRRFAYRGFTKALEIAKQYKLDIIHTQTEFSLGYWEFGLLEN